jgi:hypothetical protein
MDVFIFTISRVLKKYKKSRPFSWPHEIGAMARAFNALLWLGAILSIIFEFIAKITVGQAMALNHL